MATNAANVVVGANCSSGGIRKIGSGSDNSGSPGCVAIGVGGRISDLVRNRVETESSVPATAPSVGPAVARSQ